MDYGLLIIRIIALAVVALGVVMVFDARRISKKWFSYADQNTTARIFKIVGFVLSILGGMILIVNR